MALKKHQYAAHGGPVTALFLPWPHDDVPAKDHLPRVVSFGSHGQYVRSYDPTADTYSYVWHGQ